MWKVTFPCPVINEPWQGKCSLHTLQFPKPNAIDEGTLKGEVLFSLSENNMRLLLVSDIFFFSGIQATHSLQSPKSGTLFLGSSIFFLIKSDLRPTAWGTPSYLCFLGNSCIYILKWILDVGLSVTEANSRGSGPWLSILHSGTCFDLVVCFCKPVNWLGICKLHPSGLPPVRSLIIWTKRQNKSNTESLIWPFLCFAGCAGSQWAAGFSYEGWKYIENWLRWC